MGRDVAPVAPSGEKSAVDQAGINMFRCTHVTVPLEGIFNDSMLL